MAEQNDPIDSKQRVLVVFNPRKNPKEELQGISDWCEAKGVNYLCRLNSQGIVVALIDSRCTIAELVGDYGTFSVQEFTGTSLEKLDPKTFSASSEIPEDVLKALNELNNMSELDPKM